MRGRNVQSKKCFERDERLTMLDHMLPMHHRMELVPRGNAFPLLELLHMHNLSVSGSFDLGLQRGTESALC